MAHVLPRATSNLSFHDCTLDYQSNTFTRRASSVSSDPPTIRPHFFYSSALPIDDPLSAVPPPSSKTPAGPSRLPPRPFSTFDTKALEEAWREVQQAEIEKHGQIQDLNRQKEEQLARLDKYGAVDISLSGLKAFADAAEKAAREQRTEPPLSKLKTQPGRHDDIEHASFTQAIPVEATEIRNEEFESGLPERNRTSFRQPRRETEDDVSPSARISRHIKRQSVDAPYGASPSERDTTGTPFLRVGSRLRSRSRQKKAHSRGDAAGQVDGADTSSEGDATREPDAALEAQKPTFGQTKCSQADDHTEGALGHYDEVQPYQSASHTSRQAKRITVPVGVSRLHFVELPDFKVIIF